MSELYLIDKNGKFNSESRIMLQVVLIVIFSRYRQCFKEDQKVIVRFLKWKLKSVVTRCVHYEHCEHFDAWNLIQKFKRPLKLNVVGRFIFDYIFFFITFQSNLGKFLHFSLVISFNFFNSSLAILTCFNDLLQILRLLNQFVSQRSFWEHFLDAFESFFLHRLRIV